MPKKKSINLDDWYTAEEAQQRLSENSVERLISTTLVPLHAMAK
jgi:hypothetical protein